MYQNNDLFRPTAICETNVGESMTQPDMTYKIRDILKRAEAGQYIPVFQGDYDEEGALQIIRKPDFDLTDIDVINGNLAQLKEIQKKLNAIKKEKEEQPIPTEGIREQSEAEPTEL